MPDPTLYDSVVEWLKLLDGAARMGQKGTKPPAGYFSPAGIVLDRGCPMRLAAVQPASGPMKQCFSNSQTMAIDDDLRYAEGWAIMSSMPMPVLHAWCVGSEGLVLDYTWGRRLRGKQAAYYGVIIDTSYMLQRVFKTGTHHSLLDDYEFGFKLLKTPGLVAKVIKPCES
jgi:hypothetical protein